MDFHNKRILFIAPKTFGLSEMIFNQLQEKGAIIEFFDERPANTFLVKALIRINRNLIGNYINQYHAKIINDTADSRYDFIFFIKGESFAEHNLSKLLNLHPEAISIVYHWDSIANNKNALKLLNLFKYKFSFDKEDCQKFGMSFLPLFYYDDFSSIKTKMSHYDNEIMFVGTTHSDRYKIINKIASQVMQHGKKAYLYFFFQGKIMFYKYIYQNKEARDIDMQTVHFDSLSKDELYNLYENSKIVIDVQHPKQRGLTLRCMETLGAKRKLVTTNKDIVSYDFYNPKNIYILDRNDPVIPESFFETEFEEIPKDIYQKYSLSSWLNDIFSNRQ